MKTLTVSRDPKISAEVLMVEGDNVVPLNRHVMHYRDGDILKACYYAALEFGADEVELEDKTYSLDTLRESAFAPH